MIDAVIVGQATCIHDVHELVHEVRQTLGAHDRGTVDDRDEIVAASVDHDLGPHAAEHRSGRRKHRIAHVWMVAIDVQHVRSVPIAIRTRPAARRQAEHEAGRHQRRHRREPAVSFVLHRGRAGELPRAELRAVHPHRLVQRGRDRLALRAAREQHGRLDIRVAHEPVEGPADVVADHEQDVRRRIRKSLGGEPTHAPDQDQQASDSSQHMKVSP